MLQMPLNAVDLSAIEIISANRNFFVTQIQYGPLYFLKLFEAAPLQATTCYDDDVADAIGLMLTYI